MFFKKIAEILSLYYLKLKFRKLRKNEKIDVYFSRGTFKHDIKVFTDKKCKEEYVILDMHLLRRLFRYIVPDLYLEQVICLNYQSYIHSEIKSIVDYWINITNSHQMNLIFGGVDYFEVSIFCSREKYGKETKYISYFHENYTIGYVETVSINIYKDIENPFKFDELYVYGSSSYKILKPFTLDENGPFKITMPRLKNIKEKLLNKAELTGKTKILFLAFPGYDYLAPLTFTNILLNLKPLSNKYEIFTKFKNIRQANKYKQKSGSLDNSIKFVDGDVVEYLNKSDIVVVFNSLSFYEALLSNVYIIIPNFSDTQHAENILQESKTSLLEISDFKTITFANSIEELENMIISFDREIFKETYKKEKKYREKLLARKFYINV
ncbi:hypothetical protein [Photobacterium damselae]|uniref:hypothetical protein n=1 Tax=Photobacterium damselae TaxID=38293 RepID=UPI0012AE6F06|nr:hypothetical protein [Photobacterium damselae]